jgi:hypothetical protein
MPPGSVLWVGVQAAKSQALTVPWSSTAPRTSITIAGPSGSQACSSWGIHCTRTGLPTALESSAASSKPLCP